MRLIATWGSNTLPTTLPLLISAMALRPVSSGAGEKKPKFAEWNNLISEKVSNLYARGDYAVTHMLI